MSAEAPDVPAANEHVNGDIDSRIPQNANGHLRRNSQPPKYLHVAAVHSKQRTSCLSHDSAASPSFLGFRNLMVIVLSS